jgi:hypothetical protein
MQLPKKLDKRILTRRTLVWLGGLGDGYMVIDISSDRETFSVLDVRNDRNEGVLNKKFNSQDILFYTNKIKPHHAEILISMKGF